MPGCRGGTAKRPGAQLPATCSLLPATCYLLPARDARRETRLGQMLDAKECE